MSNFGGNFKKAREQAGLPLEKIAAETRISTRFLTAIENETFHLLPGGIFNRGFIRSYAEYLGLDANQALADYDRLSATAQEPLEELRNADRATVRASDRNLYPVAAAILLVLMGAYYFVTRKSADSPGESVTPAPVVATQEAQTPADVPAIPPQEAPQPADAETAVPSVTSPPSVPVQAATPSVTAAQPPAAPLPGPALASSAIALDLNVKDSTWIRVTTDGRIVLSEIVPPGTVRRFSADRSIHITIGNAAGATLQVNGRDLGQLGTSGQVREYRITPENAAQIKG